MSFPNRIRYALDRFMQGRNGYDNLGFSALMTALLLQLIDMFLGTGLLSLTGMVLYGYCIFRMLSRNVAKRRVENQRFVTATQGFSTKAKQYVQRLKNMRTYKYFSCPQCKAPLRLKRGCGERSITCPKCSHQFQQKA